MGVNKAVKGISSSLATDRTILDGVNNSSKDIKQTLHKNDRILGGVHTATNGITKSLKDNDTLLRGMNYAIRNIDRAQYPFTKLRFQTTFTLSLDIPKFKNITDNISNFASAHPAAVQHVDLFTPGPVNYVDLSYGDLIAFAGNDSLLYRIVRGLAYPEIVFNRQHVVRSDVQFNLPLHLEDKEKYAGRFDVYPLVYDLDSKTLFFRFNAKIDDDDPRTMRSGQLLSVLDLRYGNMGVVFQVPEYVKLPPDEIRLFRLLKITNFVLFINNQEWFLGKFSKTGLSANNVQFHFTFPTDLSQLVLESYHPKP